MAKRKKGKKRGASIPGSVRRAKGIIKKHIARLQKEKNKFESVLRATAQELKSLKNL